MSYQITLVSIQHSLLISQYPITFPQLHQTMILTLNSSSRCFNKASASQLQAPAQAIFSLTFCFLTIAFYLTYAEKISKVEQAISSQVQSATLQLKASWLKHDGQHKALPAFLKCFLIQSSFYSSQKGLKRASVLSQFGLFLPQNIGLVVGCVFSRSLSSSSQTFSSSQCSSILQMGVFILQSILSSISWFVKLTTLFQNRV